MFEFFQANFCQIFSTRARSFSLGFPLLLKHLEPVLFPSSTTKSCLIFFQVEHNLHAVHDTNYICQGTRMRSEIWLALFFAANQPKISSWRTILHSLAVWVSEFHPCSSAQVGMNGPLWLLVAHLMNAYYIWKPFKKSSKCSCQNRSPGRRNIESAFHSSINFSHGLLYIESIYQGFFFTQRATSGFSFFI